MISRKKEHAVKIPLVSSSSSTSLLKLSHRDWFFIFHVFILDLFCTLLIFVSSHSFSTICCSNFVLAQPILLHALCSYARLFGALDVDTAPIALRLVARLLPLPGNQDRYDWLLLVVMVLVLDSDQRHI